MARVRMYTTAVCPFCQMAERLLQGKGAEIDKVRVDLDPAERMAMMGKNRTAHGAADLHRRYPCRRL